MTKILSYKIVSRPWSSLLSAFVLLLYSQSSWANTITIRKVKGTQAVIEMSSPLEVGKTYNLETERLVVGTDFSNQFRSRLNSVSLGFDMSFLTANKTQDNNFNFFGKYGWNYINFEFGPVVHINVYDKGFGTNTTYLIGGYFDYNIGENKSPKELIYGPSVQVSLGNRNFESGGSAQISHAQLSAFLTWFIHRSDVAIKLEAGYQTSKVDNAAAESTLSGYASQLYFMYYY